MKVLVVGGTGHVGSQVVRTLVRKDPKIQVGIGGRRKDAGEKLAKELGSNCNFVALNLRDKQSLVSAIKGNNCVVHCAGPFQHGEPQVLVACLEAGVPYVDVSDDITYARKARKYHEMAVSKGIPAITTGGVFPGASNVLAAEMMDRLGGKEKIQKVEFDYFVAGTGGTGPTVLSTTFMIASEKVTEYVEGKAVEREAFSFDGTKVVDFPFPIGLRTTYYFDLPEVSSIHEVYGIPNVVSRFSTAPHFWNILTGAFSHYLPKSIVSSPYLSTYLVAICTPMIRMVDMCVGEALGMVVEITSKDGQVLKASYAHEKTVVSTGFSVAMMALEILQGRVAPGVWYPEQAISSENRMGFLEGASEGTSHFSIS